MTLKDQYQLLHEHISLLHEILNTQPQETVFDAIGEQFNYVQLSQLLPKDEILELVNYHTYVNSSYVHVLPFFTEVIATLLYKIQLHSFYQEIQ